MNRIKRSMPVTVTLGRVIGDEGQREDSCESRPQRLERWLHFPPRMTVLPYFVLSSSHPSRASLTVTLTEMTAQVHCDWMLANLVVTSS